MTERREVLVAWIARGLLAGGALCACVALLARARPVRGDFVVPSAFIFRSEEDLLSLRGLLDDESARGELESLSERLALWRVSTTTEQILDGEGCLPAEEAQAGPGAQEGPEERTIHRFEFADSRGVSSRVYRVEYVSCRGEEGGLRFARRRFGFGSRVQKDTKPLLGGVEPLRLLRLALHDPVVSSDLVGALREEGIAFLWVEHVGAGLTPGSQAYVLAAADASPPLEVALEYRAEYDVVRDEAVFTRL